MKIDDIRQAVYPLLVIHQNKPLFDGSTRKPAIVKQMDECIFIDDREGYCTGAKGVGMQAILYRSFSQMKPELDRLCSSGAGA